MFSKSKVLLYLHKNGITFYVDKESAGLQFDFAEDVIKNLELLNADKLKAQLASFLKDTFSSSYRATILLSEEVVLEKSILTKSPEDQRTEMQKFLDDAPFKNCSKLLYKMSGILQLVITNADVYAAVIDILGQYGWTIEAVVPIRVFGQFAANDILSQDEIDSIMKKSNLLKEGNLLVENTDSFNLAEKAAENDKVDKENEYKKNTEKVKEEESETEKPKEKEIDIQDNNSGNIEAAGVPTFLSQKKPHNSSLIKTLLLGAGIAAVVFVIGIVGLSLFTSKSIPFFPKPTPTPTQTPTPSPTPTPSLLNKSDIKVQVLNGTGIAGQAGLVKTQLTSLGYSSITTGNASSQSNTTTLVVFDNRVSKSDQTDIITSLQKLFSKVTPSSTTTSASSDIVITTGSKK
jgi:hypothetical protein